jgi:hypothetical protein
LGVARPSGDLIAESVHAVVVLADWRPFRAFDHERIYRNIKKTENPIVCSKTHFLPLNDEIFIAHIHFFSPFISLLFLTTFMAPI